MLDNWETDRGCDIEEQWGGPEAHGRDEEGPSKLIKIKDWHRLLFRRAQEVS